MVEKNESKKKKVRLPTACQSKGLKTFARPWTKEGDRKLHEERSKGTIVLPDCRSTREGGQSEVLQKGKENTPLSPYNGGHIKKNPEKSSAAKGP